MLQHRISGLPVVDDNRDLIGIVTEVTCCVASKAALTETAPGGSSFCSARQDRGMPLGGRTFEP